jgi:hypothetical protein
MKSEPKRVLSETGRANIRAALAKRRAEAKAEKVKDEKAAKFAAHSARMKKAWATRHKAAKAA